MKFRVNTVDFEDAITKAEKAIAKKVGVPVLENVKITTNNDKCVIYATNLEQFVRTEIDLLNSNGSASFILLDTKSLIKALKFFKNSEIEFEVLEGSIKVKCGNKKASLKTLDAEYPEFPVVENKIQECSYTSKKLYERYNLVKYAVSQNANNSIMTGVHFDKNNVVACDGFRLAVNSDDNMRIESSLTISESALKLCGNILENDILIGYNKKYLEIKDNNTTVIVRLFDGIYVDYNSVIPKNYNMIQVDTKNLTENLKYLKTFLNNKTDYIAWRGDCLRYNSSEGEYEASIEMQGEFNYTIGFNVDYMLNCLTQFENKVEVYMGESNVNPMLFKQGNNIALILPCRLKEDPFEKKSDAA